MEYISAPAIGRGLNLQVVTGTIPLELQYLLVGQIGTGMIIRIRLMLTDRSILVCADHHPRPVHDFYGQLYPVHGGRQLYGSV
jgi:hypothetical protein